MLVSYIVPIWVVNKELANLTRACIKSLREAIPNSEVIIVDNASKEGGNEWSALADLYVRNNENLGFTVAVRQGWLLASGDILATANNVIRVSPNWFLVGEPLLKDEIVGSVHFRMTDYDVPFKYGKSIVYKGKERWCTTSFFAIRRDLIGNLAQKEMGREPFPGFFDLNFRINSGDWDFWHRVRLAGYRQVYTDKACYQHKHSSTQKTLGVKKRGELEQQNKEYFKKKWGEYAEELFEREFPEQVKEDYFKGFDL